VPSAEVNALKISISVLAGLGTRQGRVGRDVRTHEGADVGRRLEAAFCGTLDYREPIAWPQANRDAVGRWDVLRLERGLPAQPIIVAIEKRADGIQCQSGFRQADALGQ